MIGLMKIIKRLSRVFMISLLLWSLHYPVAYAEYPTKPIECVIPWAAGSASDIATRMFLKFAEKELGKSVVPMNMVGGNGEIAWNHLKRSKPDGYTVGLITNAVLENQVMGPETEIKYDSFEYLLQFTHQPIGLFVHKDSGWKKLEDFVAAVKPKPGESAVATAPLGSIFHQAAYLLEKKYGIKLNIVPGRSSADNLAQLLGKHVDSVTMTTTIFIPHLKEGTVRMLLIYTDKRLPDFPDVPSVVELGISDVGLESWRAIAVPKEIPEPVKNTLKTAFKKAYQNPEYQALAKKSFFDPFYREHTEILDYAKKQLPILEKYVNEMGLRKGK